MNVKELIIELLEYDLDTTIDIGVKTEFDSQDFADFSIDYSTPYTTLVVKTKDYVLVDKHDFEELQNRVTELEVTIDEYANEL